MTSGEDFGFVVASMEEFERIGLSRTLGRGEVGDRPPKGR
jgi:hypothetical protein